MAAVEVASQQDLIKAVYLLREQAHQHIEQQGQTLKSRSELQLAVGAILRQVELKLAALVKPQGSELSSMPDYAGRDSPQLVGEVRQLETQVENACSRVAAKRRDCPQALHACLAEHLASRHPEDILIDVPDHSPVACQDGRLPQDLQGILGTTAVRLPAVRARLGEALQRLDRVVGAVQMERPVQSLSALKQQSAEETEDEVAAAALRRTVAKQLTAMHTSWPEAATLEAIAALKQASAAAGHCLGKMLQSLSAS